MSQHQHHCYPNLLSSLSFYQPGTWGTPQISHIKINQFSCHVEKLLSRIMGSVGTLCFWSLTHTKGQNVRISLTLLPIPLNIIFLIRPKYPNFTEVPNPVFKIYTHKAAVSFYFRVIQNICSVPHFFHVFQPQWSNWISLPHVSLPVSVSTCPTTVHTSPPVPLPVKPPQ